MKLETIEHPDKKFIETFTENEIEWEVETDTGWADIESVGKTVLYQIWRLKTSSYELLAADKHIVYRKRSEDYEECFIEDLKIGDLIYTISGDQEVLIVEETPAFDNMYDLQLKDENHRFYTNGILSHNSIWLCNLAASGVRCGYNTAFISLEMSDRKIVKRLGANLLQIKVSEYNQISEDPYEIKRKLSSISADDPFKSLGTLNIKEYPTSTASVQDVENWLRKMEEIKGIKYRLVVIDYINIMRNWRNPNTENTYMKIKQIAEDLRAMAVRNNWTILTATQFSRGAYGSSDVILEQISESAGLIHTVDSLFGIIQDDIMFMNREYYLKNLANRDDGHKGSKKRFMINYDYMRIQEDLNAEIIESQM
jgi:hypothetical protein